MVFSLARRLSVCKPPVNTRKASRQRVARQPVAEQGAEGVGEHVGGVEIAQAAPALQVFDGDAHQGEADEPAALAAGGSVDLAEPAHEKGVGEKVLDLVGEGEVDNFRWRAGEAEPDHRPQHGPADGQPQGAQAQCSGHAWGRAVRP